MKFTIYTTEKTTGKKVKLTPVCTIAADNLRQAYTIAEQITGYKPEDPEDEDDGATGSGVRVYPRPTLGDGGAIAEAARHALRSFEGWERRNTFACENPRKRQPADRENLTQEAALAIWAALKDGTTDAEELHHVAVVAIHRVQEQHNRTAARVAQYSPDYRNHNFTGYKPQPTCEALCNLLKQAVKNCGLTAKQAQALDLKIDSGLSFAALGELLDCNSRNAAKNVYAAQVKILSYLLECDELEDALHNSGLTLSDLLIARDTRADKDKKAKGRAVTVRPTLVTYDIVCVNGQILSGMLEELPADWNNERIAEYIHRYLVAPGDCINIRCNNPQVNALL